MSGTGLSIGGRRSTKPTRPRRVAHLRPVNRAATIRCHPRSASKKTRERPATKPTTRLSMRVCAQVALISAYISACFGLAGCAAIDELRDTFLRWVESEKLPSERGVFVAPDVTPVVPPEKPAKKEASRTSKKQDESARKLQRPQSVVLPPKKPSISASPETTRPDETEGQSAPPASMRLRTPFPEAPPPGIFSR